MTTASSAQESGTDAADTLEINVYATPRKPRVSVYGQKAADIAQSTTSIQGKDASKLGSDRLEDFIDYVPGITSAYGGGEQSTIMLRGFQLTREAQVDGLPDVHGAYLRDPATLESIDIAKGRDSILFGSGTPGGSINLVSKKPHFRKHRSFSILGGTPAQLRSQLDIEAPLSNPDWAGRLVISGQRAKTDHDNVGDDRFSLAPSLRWQNDNNDLTLQLEHGWQNREPDSTTLLYNGSPVYNVSYVDPRAFAARRMTRLGVDYTHNINDNWETNLQANAIKSSEKQQWISFADLADTPNTLLGYYRKNEDSRQQNAIRLELVHKQTAPARESQTRLGFSRRATDLTSDWGSQIGGFTLDIYHPSFDYSLPDATQLPWSSDFHYQEQAWYLQHHIKLHEKLGITAGIRRTNQANIGGTLRYYPANLSYSSTNLDARNTSSSLGITWQATPTWEAFASHIESFDLNVGTDRQNNFFDPQQGVQHEIGIRHTQTDEQGETLAANLSAYRIDLKNVLSTDPVDPAYSIATGGIRSQGVEATLEKKLTPKLKLNVAYNRGDTHITRSEPDLLDKRWPNTPKQSGSLMLTYTPKQDNELLLGAVYIGKRAGNITNTFDVPAYTRLDAAARWKLGKQTTLTASVRNLLDKDYIAGARDSTLLTQGRKRSVTAGLEVNF